MTDEPPGGSATPTTAPYFAVRMTCADAPLLASPSVATCYRHPSRETGVSCSSCGNPICPDCMTPTPVGMRCPECAEPEDEGAHGARRWRVEPTRDLRAHRDQRRRVLRAGRHRGRRAAREQRRRSTRTACCSGRSSTTASGGGSSPAASCTPTRSTCSSTWSSCTSSASCSSRRSATCKFAALYFASLLAGSFGALLLLARGARPSARRARSSACSARRSSSCATAASRSRRRCHRPAAHHQHPLHVRCPGISIGGHLGGLVGGALAALLVAPGRPAPLDRARRSPAAPRSRVAAVVGGDRRRQARRASTSR